VPAVDTWVRVDRAQWQRQSGELKGSNIIEHWVTYLLRHAQSQRKGTLPQRPEFVSDATIDWVVRATQHPLGDRPYRERVRSAMETILRYEEHLHYEGQNLPRPKG
jgi:hypothetical protein